MKVEITTTHYENENTHIKGFASIKLDEKYALESVKIKENSQGGLYIELPKIAKLIKENGNTVYDYNGNPMKEYVEPFHPITADNREQLYTAILSRFKDEQKGYKTFEISASSDISKVFTNEYEKENVRGFATVSFGDAFILENVVIKSGQNGEYLDLPKYRTKARDENGQIEKDENGNDKIAYRDIYHPITAETQSELKNIVLNSLNFTRQQNQNNYQQQQNEPLSSLDDFENVNETQTAGRR